MLLASGAKKATTRRKRPGRRKADYEQKQAEAEIAKEWKRARGTGVYKVTFAKDKGYSPSEFRRLLDRVRKNIAASEK